MLEQTTERVYSGKFAIKMTNLTTNGNAWMPMRQEILPRVPLGVDMIATTDYQSPALARLSMCPKQPAFATSPPPAC